MTEYRVADRGLTKLPREGEMTVVINILVVKKDYLPFQQRSADFFDDFRRQWLGQIDTVNLCADMNRKWAHADFRRHSFTS